MRARITLFLILFLGVPAEAQLVKIARYNRVNNFSPGYCAWCSLEMLGYHHSISELNSLSKVRSQESDFTYWNGRAWVREPYVWNNVNGVYYKEPIATGGEWAVYNKLVSMRVSFRMQYYGDKRLDLINYAMRNNLGCVFGIYEIIKGQPWSHAMVLVDFNDKEVAFVDPNESSETHRRSRAWFDARWTGYLIVVQPKSFIAKR